MEMKTEPEPKLDGYILKMMSRHKLKRDLVDAETDDGSGDLSSTEFALSLQHVLEQIFQSLPTSTLLQCRLVCHKWNFFAISPLQNQVTLEFDYNGSYNRGAGSKKSLREFTNLLQQHSRIFPCSPFPCTKCNIEKSCDKFWFFRNDKMLNKLFTHHGANLREVSLSIFNHHGRRNNKPYLKMILDQIQNLITYQVPNVHTLELRVHVYKQEPSNLSEYDKNLRSIKTSTKPAEVKLNKKLKVLHLPRLFESSDFSGPVTIFKMIVELAPNLTEIVTNKPEDYILLLGPLHRFDLIKKLNISIREVRDIELFEKLITHAINSESPGPGPTPTPIARTNLKLREISISLVDKTSSNPVSLFASPEIKSRIAKVINAALGSSWDSLNTIYWGGVTVLRDLEFPPVMPNVRKIELGDPFRISSGQMIFPHKFCWEETFPNLRYVGLYNHGFLDNSSVLTRRFNRFNNNNNNNNENNAIMDNEALVEVSFMDFISSVRGELSKKRNGSAIRIGVRNGSREAKSHEILRIKTLFPSAQVQDWNSGAGGGT